MMSSPTLLQEKLEPELVPLVTAHPSIDGPDHRGDEMNSISSQERARDSPRRGANRGAEKKRDDGTRCSHGLSVPFALHDAGHVAFSRFRRTPVLAVNRLPHRCVGLVLNRD